MHRRCRTSEEVLGLISIPKYGYDCEASISQAARQGIASPRISKHRRRDGLAAADIGNREAGLSKTPLLGISKR